MFESSRNAIPIVQPAPVETVGEEVNCPIIVEVKQLLLPPKEGVNPEKPVEETPNQRETDMDREHCPVAL